MSDVPQMPVKVALLAENAANGSIAAVCELWELVFDQPLDVTRPIMEVAEEVALAIAAQFGEQATQAPRP